jgi:phospholipid/cholesterol/gamma-HCH transport system substrate-binding protein
VSTEKPLPPLPPSRGKHREVWVGLFVVAGLAATLLTLAVMTDAALFRGRYIITTNVPNAGGLRKGDPVQMRGVNIGRIQGFRIAPEGVAIRLEVEGEYRMPSDSRVELRSAGLLGGMVADIVPGTSATPARGGDVLAGSTPETIFDQAGKIADESDKVLQRVRALLSEQMIADVQSGTSDLRTLLKDLAEVTSKQKKDLMELTASLRRVSQGVEKVTTGPELEDAVKRVNSLAQRLETLSDTLDRSATTTETLLGRIERGEGTLGRLSKDESLYVNANEAVANLNNAVVEMRKLTEDIRKQPKRYLKLSLF